MLRKKDFIIISVIFKTEQLISSQTNCPLKKGNNYLLNLIIMYYSFPL